MYICICHCVNEARIEACVKEHPDISTVEDLKQYIDISNTCFGCDFDIQEIINRCKTTYHPS